jgi:ribonuclease-3
VTDPDPTPSPLPWPDAPVLLARRLGIPLGRDIAEQSLTHRSYAYENGGLPTNERLEFLGDSVLGLVVTETLYLTHPDLPEGQLAKLRAAVVNMKALADVGRRLELGRYVRLGKGEEATGGRDKSSILADCVESVIGAVYVDRGLETAAELVHRLFDPVIDEARGLGAGLDWKTSLQEMTALHDLGVPEYRLADTGPDHAKTFTATVYVGGAPYGTGHGRSKKDAEQEAAATTWHALREEHEVAVDEPGEPSGSAEPRLG